MRPTRPCFDNAAAGARHDASAPPLRFGDADVLASIADPRVQLAVWTRGADFSWREWVEGLAPVALPVCRTATTAAEVPDLLRAQCERSRAPSGAGRDAFIDDVAQLAARFAAIARVQTIRLRLEAIDDDACRRWHRDFVPLRLLCTYRGPGTQWVEPTHAARALAEPEAEIEDARSLRTGDVGLLKGCGWAGQGSDSGIAHRSPRLAGSGRVRLLLAIDLPAPSVHG